MRQLGAGPSLKVDLVRRLLDQVAIGAAKNQHLAGVDALRSPGEGSEGWYSLDFHLLPLVGDRVISFDDGTRQDWAVRLSALAVARDSTKHEDEVVDHQVREVGSGCLHVCATLPFDFVILAQLLGQPG